MNMNISDELVSIIVPVYNTEEYLGKCLNSLVNQTYRNIEIICINDGSTDDSLQLLMDYQKKDDRIIIIDQVNAGLSAARNKGLQCARGSYIVFVDSDDWVDLNMCKDAMAEAKETCADLVFWSYAREYPNKSKETILYGDTKKVLNAEETNELYRRFVGLVKYELREPEKIDSCITAWGKLYKKDLLEGILFVDTKIIGTEDALFNIMVMEKINKVVYLPYVYNHYRKNNMSSLTHSYKKNLVIQWKALYEMIFQILEKRNVPPVFFEALANRTSLGLIGLGLNLVEDTSMSYVDKHRELTEILSMPHYKVALNKLDLKYFHIHWKLFFFLAKHGFACPLYGLLCIMNKLRSN